VARLAIVTDSIACIPAELVTQHDIHVVPLRVTFGRHCYRDGVDLTADEFYRRFLEADDPPTTSQPSAGEFLQVYTELARRADDIVSIHPAADLTGGYNAARVAQGLVEDARVHLVDTRTAGIAQGLVVLAAARSATSGEAEAVVARAQAVAGQVQMFGFLDTLKYVQRGGRLNRVLRLTDSLLRVRPLFRIGQGQIGLLGGARTSQQAEERLLQAMVEQVGDRPVHMGVSHAARPDAAQRLLDQACERLRCVEAIVAPFTPAMGVHTGPGVLAVAFYVDSPSPDSGS